MQNWEYRFEPLLSQKETQLLNEWASEGWEPIAMTALANSSLRVILRRPKSN